MAMVFQEISGQLDDGLYDEEKRVCDMLVPTAAVCTFIALYSMFHPFYFLI
jgi:hypothetical protein